MGSPNTTEPRTRPAISRRIRRLQERMGQIDRERRRVFFAVSSDIALGQASSGPPVGKRAGILQASVDKPRSEDFVLLGDQCSTVRVDRPFPGNIPSQEHGTRYGPTRIFPDSHELEQLADRAEELGAGGFPHTHTCADLEIGLEQGWGKILDRIRAARRAWEVRNQQKQVQYLEGLEIVCRAIMRFITRHAEQARELIAELFLKFPTFYSLGGRSEQGEDATNELSWVFLQAYDMIGGTNEFGVLWHSDIDPQFFRYACEVLMRHGGGSPALINQDCLRDSEVQYGVSPEHAWNVAYSGCFWYCIPGREWCAHDTLAVNGLKCFLKALGEAVECGITAFEELISMFTDKLNSAVRALKEMTDWQFARIPDVFPEMVTSLLTHGCIDSGVDISDCGVPYNSVVVQFAGLANIADSLIAIQKMIFNEKIISLQRLGEALKANFSGYEKERRLLLACPKYGNDIEEADQMAARVSAIFREVLGRYVTCKGTRYRPAFFSWAGHAYAEKTLGASPDGRNKRGLTATAKSVSVLDFPRNAGGPLQLELDPSIRRLPDPTAVLAGLAAGYFELGGVHILANVVSTETLKEAIEHPELHEDLVIRVTGFSVHFVQLDRKIQEEIVQRTRHQGG